MSAHSRASASGGESTPPDAEESFAVAPVLRKTGSRFFARRSGGQRGAALIIVLWVALLLAVVMAGAMAAARIEARIAAARIERFKAVEAARAGLEHAAYLIAVDGAPDNGDWSKMSLSLDGYDVAVGPSVESDKLDLNLASESVLAGLFRFLNMRDEDAAALAARIADWRDADDLSRPNGAEARDYAGKTGAAIGDRPFNAVSELKEVLGVSDTLFDCAEPALTVFGDGDAPSPALLEQLYRRRPEGGLEPTRVQLGTASRAATAGRRFAITATARRSEDAGRLAPQKRTGVFRVTGRPEKPYEWIVQFPTPEPPSPPACAKPEQ